MVFSFRFRKMTNLSLEFSRNIRVHGNEYMFALCKCYNVSKPKETRYGLLIIVNGGFLGFQEIQYGFSQDYDRYHIHLSISDEICHGMFQLLIPVKVLINMVLSYVS